MSTDSGMPNNYVINYTINYVMTNTANYIKTSKVLYSQLFWIFSHN